MVLSTEQVFTKGDKVRVIRQSRIGSNNPRGLEPRTVYTVEAAFLIMGKIPAVRLTGVSKVINEYRLGLVDANGVVVWRTQDPGYNSWEDVS